jgi:hypothetical protein
VKDAISASDLPSHCRTWDDKRRVWVPKTRWATATEANKAAGKKMRGYKCKTGQHFHIGHPGKGSR